MLRTLLSWRFQRDTMIRLVATGLLIYEVVEGGGRPSVLTALVALFVSPSAIKLDERRNRESDGS